MKHRITLLLLVQLFAWFALQAQEVIRIGVVGLDTSHSEAFIRLLNEANPEPQYAGFKVVAAYPYGSRTIESSMKRIPEYTEGAKKNGVKITSSIAELLKTVDCVLLETNDGTLHLEQAVEVIKSGKPLFLDKPVAATLPDAIAIYRFAEERNVPIFSSSALRYSPRNQELRAGKEGKVVGADCYSPCTEEPSHAGFYWYGIHGVETLYTLMGTGCESVSCVSTEGTDVAVGVWKDGRIGTFRGLREGARPYGGTAFCEKKMFPAGGYEGYGKLLETILTFFKT
ncbi:Gfo/Idh/MocA family protein, partial [uncultured Parabacteroides sp.]